MDTTFIIVREDLQVDPVTIVAEGILIGRLPTCELLLNHPSVSRLQAGVTNVGGDYYIRNFRAGNPILLNGVRLGYTSAPMRRSRRRTVCSQHRFD